MELKRTSISKRWTEFDIRAEIARLDAITGLNGAALPIKIGKARRSMGSFTYSTKIQYFTFSSVFFADEAFPEEQKLDTIRHEYAHYMNFARRTGQGHDAAWKKCCLEVGAYPERCVSNTRLELARKQQLERQARNAAYDGYRIGQLLEHPRFGWGVIVRIYGDGAQRNLEIRFDTHGLKRMGFQWVIDNCRFPEAV